MKNFQKRRLARASPAKRARIKRHQKIKASRPLHKKILLQPLIVFFWLCVGVFLVFLTVQAFASDLTVTAKVSAPLLNEPVDVETASIGNFTTEQIQQATMPANALIINTNNVDIGGNCPKDSYIKVTRNGVFAGTTPCVGDPVFSVNIALDPGLNTIDFQDYNFTDDPGPDTPSVYIYYSPPVVNTPPKITTVKESGVPPPLTKSNPINLISNYTYKSSSVGQSSTWQINIVGGQGPYKIDINFGDNTTESLVIISSGPFSFSHIYKKQPKSDNSFIVSIVITDANGNKSNLQLVAYIKPPAKKSQPAISVTNNKIPDSYFGSSITHWLWFAWPAYLIVLLMIISFWLGEMQEIWQINKKRARKHKR